MDLSSLMGGGGGGGGIEAKSQATSTANAGDYSSGGAGTLPDWLLPVAVLAILAFILFRAFKS